MRKNFFKAFYLVIALFFLFAVLISQVYQVVIYPDREIIYLDTEGPPTFTIEADPNIVICVEVATEKNLLIAQPKQTDDNFFSSLKGNKNVSGQQIKTDDRGELTYTLPQGAWNALTGKDVRILLYYRAYQIKNNNPEWGTLSVLNWEDAPSVEIYKEIGMKNAYDCFEKGKELVGQGEYVEAIKQFESAWLYWDDPGFLYNIGICYVCLAHQSFKETIEFSDTTGQIKKDAEKHIQKLEEIAPSLK